MEAPQENGPGSPQPSTCSAEYAFRLSASLGRVLFILKETYILDLLQACELPTVPSLVGRSIMFSLGEFFPFARFLPPIPLSSIPNPPSSSHLCQAIQPDIDEKLCGIICDMRRRLVATAQKAKRKDIGDEECVYRYRSHGSAFQDFPFFTSVH